MNNFASNNLEEAKSVLNTDTECVERMIVSSPNLRRPLTKMKNHLIQLGCSHLNSYNIRILFEMSK